MKVLAIAGSPRPHSNTDYLVEQALEEINKYGIETEKVLLRKYKIHGCVGHDECGTFQSCTFKDDGAWILNRLVEADGVILATPVYYFNVTAQLKAFIDRNYFLYKHNQKSKAKSVGLIVVAGGEGIEDTVNTLQKYIAESFDVPNDRLLVLTGYAGGKDTIKDKPLLVEEARRMGRKMAETLNSLQNSPPK